jgi:hypothetical protein
LLVDCDQKNSYFIELKGHHLLDAIKQIDRTLDIFSEILPSFNSVKARIVLSKVNTPDLRSSLYTKLLKKLKRINKTRININELLKQKSVILEEYI